MIKSPWRSMFLALVLSCTLVGCGGGDDDDDDDDDDDSADVSPSCFMICVIDGFDYNSCDSATGLTEADCAQAETDNCAGAADNLEFTATCEGCDPSCAPSWYPVD